MSGFEAADRRNSWETFKLLLLDDTHHQLAALVNSNFSKLSDTINLIVTVVVDGRFVHKISFTEDWCASCNN